MGGRKREKRRGRMMKIVTWLNTFEHGSGVRAVWVLSLSPFESTQPSSASADELNTAWRGLYKSQEGHTNPTLC